MKTLRFNLPSSLLLLACLVLSSVLGCQHQQEPAASASSEKEIPQIQAETLVVRATNWPKSVRGQGSLYPDEEATLGIKVEGRVVDIHVDLGDAVKAGDPLLTVYQDDFKLRVEQARAQLSQARSALGLKPEDLIDELQPHDAPEVREQRALWDEATSNLQRAQDLKSRNAIVQSEFDQVASAERVAAARYDSALNNVLEKISLVHVQQALLGLAEENLRNSVLEAPFDAVVQRRLVAPGSYVKVGDPLFVLVRVSQLRYRGTVPERLSQLLRVGQVVNLKIESVEDFKQVKVTRISPFLDQTSRALLFEAIVDNSAQELRAGLFAEAQVVVDPDAIAVVIPASAVSRFAGNDKVWKLVDGQLKEQVVAVSELRGNQFSVTEGLADGDIVLVNAALGVAGATVENVVPQTVSSTP